MTESEKEPQSPKNELLDKINQKISHHKSSELDSAENTIEENLVESDVPLNQDKVLEESSPEALMTKYGEVEHIDDEVLEKELHGKKEESPKRSWLKIFFIFLFVVLLFNISYIIYMMDKKEEPSEKSNSENTIEVLKPIEKEVNSTRIMPIVKKMPVDVEPIEKMIEKPLEEAIENAVKKLEKESAIPIVIQRPKEIDSEIGKEKVDTLEEKPKVEKPQENVPVLPKKNPNDYIDVIEMRSVSSKMEVIERRRPLSPQDKKALERQRAKDSLLEQMKN